MISKFRNRTNTHVPVIQIQYTNYTPTLGPMLERDVWRKLRDLESQSWTDTKDTIETRKLHALGLIVWNRRGWDLTSSGRATLQTGRL